jgi:ribosomal protein L34E
MTQAEILESRPWLQAVIDHRKIDLVQKCPYCGAELGAIHAKTCDIARTVTGAKQYKTKLKPTEPWLGILYPHAHRICVRDNLFCRDLVLRNGKYVPERYTFEETRNGSVKFHEPCTAEDGGSHFDVNQGMDLAFEEKAFAIPL